MQTRKNPLAILRTCWRLSSTTSYLYPPREGQTKIMTVVKPHLPDALDSRHIQRLSSNLRARKLPDVDLGVLARALTELRSIKPRIDEIDRAREANTTLVKERLASGDTEETISHMFRDGQNLRAQHKNLSQLRYDLEDVAVPQLLQLPNDLHPVTPIDHQSRTVFVHGTPPRFQFSCLDHVTIGRRTGTLEFVETDADHTVPGTYYLRGRAAFLELAVQDWFANRLDAAGFVPFANPDFCKPFISEGCGLSMDDPSDTVWLKPDSNLVDIHLCGSASLTAFCAYHTKQSVNQLPVKYYTTGRCYRAAPLMPNAEHGNLFNVSQAVTTHFFSAGDSESSDRLFEDVVRLLQDVLVELFDLHFRVVEVEAAGLDRAESRRTEFQVWSPYSGRFRTVSTVAACTDYISKRLWMIHRDAARWDFLHVVHGTAVSFPELLACIIETTQTADGSFTIPKFLEHYMLGSD